MKCRGKDDNIVGRVLDQEVDQARVSRGVESESSQIRVGRVASTGSHQNRLAEQSQFRAPRSTRCRLVRPV